MAWTPSPREALYHHPSQATAHRYRLALHRRARAVRGALGCAWQASVPVRVLVTLTAGGIVGAGSTLAVWLA